MLASSPIPPDTAPPEPDAPATQAPLIAADPVLVRDPLVPIYPLVPPDPLAPTEPLVRIEPLAPDAPPVSSTEEEIIVEGRDRRGDPMAPVNEQSFEATQAVDKAIVAPAAKAYKKAVPRPFRDGLRNFLGNLREPVVVVNYLLQLKPGKAAETLGRFAINSTIGGAGIFDVAKRKPFKLPRRRNGFANTLGYYGVGPGPFVYLPLIGATTVRDFLGNTLDTFVSPVTFIKPFNKPEFVIPTGVLTALDARIELDEELENVRASRDSYGAMRKYYLDKRQAEIDALRGRGKVPVAMPEADAPLEPAPLP